MKKITTSLLLIFSWPFRLIKKSKIDNFVGGLIFGAIFSLIVNILTVQIQETIQKQHILEAIENEILTNTLTANSIASANQKQIEANDKFNVFYGTQRYTRDIWTQSSEPLQYIAQLDPDIQIAITGYYSTTVNLTNSLLDRVDKLGDSEFKDCFSLWETVDVEQQEKCNKSYIMVLGFERDSALQIAKNGFDILNKFHPTQDRLNNWFLRLVMGDKSTRVLSGQ